MATKVVKVLGTKTEEIIGMRVITGATGDKESLNGSTLIRTSTKKIFLNKGSVVPESAETITYDEVLLEGKGDTIYTNDIMFGKFNTKQLQDAKLERVKSLGLENVTV